ncbi:RmlC-like cupin [Macrolepiota fuliginosa MF-IS2]|uniref:homogentisate 1,2-dioxygenase n=1 Tax=Macrolepiota fuliginosa MF-IS2 TaxID=1400762 RepID=A0A9P6C4B3_9AGAR|nr:RmlC-like cupin [Macrolepiota fuliginosa MF-IS2]
MILGERWDVADHTFRPPYYHRNSSVEFLGFICGSFLGRGDSFQPGGASLETNFCPHGLSYDVWKVFLIESGMTLTVTDYAINRCETKDEHNPKMWDNLKADLMNHLDEVNADLKTAGLPQLGSQ